MDFITCSIDQNVLNIKTLAGCYAEFNPDGKAKIVLPDDAEHTLFNSLSMNINLITIVSASLYWYMETYFKDIHLLPNYTRTVTLYLINCFFPR